jgi:hypothetical protein
MGCISFHVLSFNLSDFLINLCSPQGLGRGGNGYDDGTCGMSKTLNRGESVWCFIPSFFSRFYPVSSIPSPFVISFVSCFIVLTA